MSQKDESKAMEKGPGHTTPTMTSSASPAGDLGGEIGKHLKALYGQHVQEPLPDKFTKLLDLLAKAEPKK